MDDEIIKRDIFMLFWSEHAKESRWVTWEWQTALKDKGKDHMQIHPLEPNVKPPEELSDLHFGDVYMWVRKGYAAGRQENECSRNRLTHERPKPPDLRRLWC